MAVDPHSYRQVASRLATGVTVLTTTDEAGRPVVLTAGSVTSVSLDPVLLLASVRRDSTWTRHLRRAGCFAVNILDAAQEELSRWCAGRERHAHPQTVLEHPSRISPTTGLLLFDEALASFECLLHQEHVAGDHDLLLGEVVDMCAREEGSPLLFFRSSYAQLAPA